MEGTKPMTPEELYKIIQNVETGGEKNPWIRTRSEVKGGSTAFGPVQVTKGRLEDILRKYGKHMTSEEKQAVNKILEVQKKFLAYGANKNYKESEKYRKDPRYSKYQYGAAPEILTPSERKAYERVMQKEMGDFLKKTPNPTAEQIAQFWHRTSKHDTPEEQKTKLSTYQDRLQVPTRTNNKDTRMAENKGPRMAENKPNEPRKTRSWSDVLLNPMGDFGSSFGGSVPTGSIFGQKPKRPDDEFSLSPTLPTPKTNEQRKEDALARVRESVAKRPATPEEPAKDQGPSLNQQISSKIEEFQNATDDLYEQYKSKPEQFDAQAKQVDEDFLNTIKEANELYKVSQDKVAAGQLWESVIQGIGHIVAGLVGHQTGLNLGGLKFNSNNWAEQREIIQNELQNAKQDAYKKLSNDRQRIADQRMAAAKNYQMQTDQLDRAQRKTLQEINLLQKERNRQEAVLSDYQKNLSKLNDAKVKQLQTYVENTEKAVKKYGDKKGPTTLKNVELEAFKANKFAKDNGLLAPYPDNFGVDPAGMFNTPSHEELINIIMKYQPLSIEDQEALKWANANPLDPRATAIKKRLGR